MATYIFYDSSYASLGASGAIFGIFGAFGALVYYTRRTMPMLRKLILPIIVISVIMTFLQPNVNVFCSFRRSSNRIYPWTCLFTSKKNFKLAQTKDGW